MDIIKELWHQKISRYCAFLGMMGGLATFLGPNKLIFVKILMGITVGCMILGEKLPAALKDYLQWSKEKFKNGSKQ